MLTNKQVQDFIKSGKRLECPNECSKEIYKKLLLPCWLKNKNKRPNFTNILQIVEGLTSMIYI